MIIRHIQSLRQHREYRQAVYYLYVENNSGFWNPQLIEREVQRPEHGLGRVIVADFDRQHRGGVPTGTDSKPAYTYMVRDLLVRCQLRIAMHTIGKDFDGNLAKLYSQLGNWRKIVKEPTQPGFVEPKITFGGKVGGENDDILIGLMISAYYGDLQFKRDMLS